MKKLSRFPLVAMLTGLALTVFASASEANFVVEFSYGGAKVTVDATMQTASATGGASLSGATFVWGSDTVEIYGLTVSNTQTTGGFKISASLSSSNMPGTPTIATIDTSSLSIKNQTGVNGNSTLVMKTSDTGFTAPATNPVILTSTASVTTSGTNTHNASFVFNSYLVNGTDLQNGTYYGSPTLSFTGITPGTSASDNSSTPVPLNSTPYSLVQVGQYTLYNGEKFTDGSTGTSVFPTPAPSGLLLALTGVPILGFGAWLRRRRNVPVELEPKV